MDAPFFTVFIPTYNRESFVLKAIKSVLNQKFDDFEIIIIDDGSTDNTNGAINSLIVKSQDSRIRYYEKENGGKYTALNLGISLAQGDFFIILDSEDILCPDTLLTMNRLLKDNPNMDGVIGQYVKDDGTVIGSLFPPDMKTIDYIDFHFGSGFSFHGNRYEDCLECNRTSSLKNLFIPEDSNIKFVPESYIFNQLGTEHKLLVSNSIFSKTAYLEDGITANYGSEFDSKNYLGFLLKYKSDIDFIFKHSQIKFLPKIWTWLNYWRFHKYDSLNKVAVTRVSLLGMITRPLLPLAMAVRKIIK
ncbi:glycosyltransferase family 2 protein [Lactobacillus sp. DCY120]|uniref:Glycosyltransferase family 2 protein n=1 Tax=Bombilactobacillus apium TaxID=2675299 RepID=A0A850R2F9_9LACO|nr:glycosyltransferase family 2 protein [Bombilactobacillus apium]NVY96201.1 glycosyltransferase family 2 protein [Bombilactobacillus apium]